LIRENTESTTLKYGELIKIIRFQIFIG